MDIAKVNKLKENLAVESVTTAMLLDIVDFVDVISKRCEIRGSKLTDKEHKIMILTANYLLAKKTEGYK